MITTQNLKKGFGIAFDWFGGKVEFSLNELNNFIADEFVKKIYVNINGERITRVK